MTNPSDKKRNWTSLRLKVIYRRGERLPGQRRRFKDTNEASRAALRSRTRQRNVQVRDLRKTRNRLYVIIDTNVQAHGGWRNWWNTGNKKNQSVVKFIKTYHPWLKSLVQQSGLLLFRFLVIIWMKLRKDTNTILNETSVRAARYEVRRRTEELRITYYLGQCRDTSDRPANVLSRGCPFPRHFSWSVAPSRIRLYVAHCLQCQTSPAT